MGEELTRTLRVLAERGEPRGAPAVLEEARAETAGVSTSIQPGWRRGLIVAFGTAGGVLALIAATILLLQPFGGEEISPATTESPVVPTTVPVKPLPGADSSGPLNDINDLALAPGGSVWAATSAGVVRWDIEGGGFEVFLEKDGVPGRSVESIDIAPDGTVWVAGDYGVARFAGSWQVVSDKPGPLVVDQQGVVWVASESLLRYDGSWAAVTAEIDGALISVLPQDLAIDREGTLWAVSRDIVYAFDGSTWRHFTEADGIPGQLWHIAVAPDGAVWAWGGGYHTGPNLEEYVPGTGFARYDGSEWTTYTVDDGLLTNDGELVIGADGSVAVVHQAWGPDHEEIVLGVSRFDGGEWATLTGVADGSFGPVVSVATGVDGTLWMPGPEGISGFAGPQQVVLAVPPEAASPPYPMVTFEPIADQSPTAISTIIGDFEFTTLQPSPYRDFFLALTTPYGPVSYHGDLLSWSRDGSTWQQTPIEGSWRWITTDGADLVLFGRGFARYSWDGDGWVEVGRSDLPGEVQGIAFGHGGAVALVENRVYYSPDGVEFVPADAGPGDSDPGSGVSCGIVGPALAVAGDGIGPILATDGGFMILAPADSNWDRSPLCEPVVWFSVDGRLWEETTLESPFGANAAIRDVAVYDGRFVAIGGTSPADGAVWVSTDGVSWQQSDVELDAALAVAGGELGWFLTGNVDNFDPLAFDMWFSADGLAWDGPFEGPEGLGFLYFRTEPSVGSDAIFSVTGTHDGIILGRLEE